ncbi:hypothetical protein Cgig2_002733 [Carnegiea gigantea]|uniref:Uncharacterized protein n=1 Tax=Carnegiea gigantea TaxID=171969 RepID=A0A9Q1GXF8_9CARY|nr:hypothetical protein Cgig2_002733 [Carnegiea gigantea]
MVPTMVFSRKEAPRFASPHNDPLVVEMKIASAILLDIITWDFLKKLTYPGRDIVSLVHPILGFCGQEVNPTRMIHLPVRFGDKLKSKNLEVDFLVVDVPMAYNVILGRSLQSPDEEETGDHSYKCAINSYTFCGWLIHCGIRLGDHESARPFLLSTDSPGVDGPSGDEELVDTPSEDELLDELSEEELEEASPEGYITSISELRTLGVEEYSQLDHEGVSGTPATTRPSIKAGRLGNCECRPSAWGPANPSRTSVIYDHGIEDYLHHLREVGIVGISSGHLEVKTGTQDVVV